MHGPRGRGPAWLAGVVAATALLTVTACSTAPSRPGWLDGPAEGYPGDRYTRGVGAAPSAAKAAEKAIASVGEQTAGETEGTVVVETWSDPDSGTSWALAVLDRDRAAERLQGHLTALETQLARARESAGAAPPDEALRSLGHAVSKLEARNELRRRIARLGGAPAGDDAAAAREAALLREQLADLKKSLRIEIDAFETDPVTGEARDPLEANRLALVQTVLEMGFSPEPADTAWGHDAVWLRVESTLSLDRLQLHPDDTLVAVRWNAVLKIVDVARGGDMAAVLTGEGRATHLNEKEARRLARAEARAFAASALEQWLRERSQAGEKTAASRAGDT